MSVTQKLKNLINNYFDYINADVDKENDKIILNKYILNDNSTNMGKQEFYEMYIKTLGISDQNNIVFYLTNGVNKKLEPKQHGTNLTITNINQEFFDLKNNDCIFRSKPYVDNNALNVKNQYITKKGMYDDCIHPGSIYFKNIPKFKYLNKYNIGGVYHINGWDHRILNVEKDPEYERLVTAYYTAIMDDFFNKISNDKMSILHLIQCPGDIFNAGDETRRIFKNTVYGYLYSNKERLNNLNFRISIDYKEKD